MEVEQMARPVEEEVVQLIYHVAQLSWWLQEVEAEEDDMTGVVMEEQEED